MEQMKTSTSYLAVFCDDQGRCVAGQHMSAHPGLASSCTVPCMPAASVPNSQPGCFLMPAQPSLAGQAPLVVPSAQCPPQAVFDPILGSFTPADMRCKPVQVSTFPIGCSLAVAAQWSYLWHGKDRSYWSAVCLFALHRIACRILVLMQQSNRSCHLCCTSRCQGQPFSPALAQRLPRKNFQHMPLQAAPVLLSMQSLCSWDI